MYYPTPQKIFLSLYNQIKQNFLNSIIPIKPDWQIESIGKLTNLQYLTWLSMSMASALSALFFRAASLLARSSTIMSSFSVSCSAWRTCESSASFIIRSSIFSFSDRLWADASSVQYRTRENKRDSNDVSLLILLLDNTEVGITTNIFWKYRSTWDWRQQCAIQI